MNLNQPFLTQLYDREDMAMARAPKRVALITGANRGIGFEIAKLLAQRDMTVVIGARNTKKGTQAREKLAGQGLDAHYLKLDVNDKINVKAVMAKIQYRFSRLDILVNNAGIMIDEGIGVTELRVSMFESTLRTNVFGPLLMSQASVPLMKINDYGRIVNISSTLGSLSDMSEADSSYSRVRVPAYRLSKTLLNGITVLMAMDLRDTNILVNSACPGWVQTRMGGEQAPLTPAQAADTPVWLATLPDNGPTGGFFRQRQPIDW
jgi:NAD(P)-dependent dehydrogenase (short-subunit alcohol dehydrogenase family)